MARIFRIHLREQLVERFSSKPPVRFHSASRPFSRACTCDSLNQVGISSLSLEFGNHFRSQLRLKTAQQFAVAIAHKHGGRLLAA